jgi:hypothetical protein
MGTGINFNYNAAANYSIQQRFQAGGMPGLESTLNTGFSAAAQVAGSGFGPQIGQFASSFAGMNINPFAAGMGGFSPAGGLGFGNIAPFGYTPNPMAELAYQSRYSGAQFAAGGFSSFRGGVANQLAMGGQQFQLPGFFAQSAAAALSGQQFGLPAEFQLMNRDFNQRVARDVSALVAQGASPEIIEGHVRNLRMNHIQETIALASTISKTAHNIASSIISKISA